MEGIFNSTEFFELIKDFFTSEELFNQLKSMIHTRDQSRRHHNFLCKPLSEFDASNFRKISYSYFWMPP